MCRADIPYQYDPKIDKSCQEKIMELKPQEYNKRYQELKQEGKLVGDQYELEFEIGHRYQFKHTTKPQLGRQTQEKAQHRCTPFVRIKDPALRPLINSIVHDVEFKLCECNNQNCENTIRKKPKCNNCENCLKK